MALRLLFNRILNAHSCSKMLAIEALLDGDCTGKLAIDFNPADYLRDEKLKVVNRVEDICSICGSNALTHFQSITT
jgi:hypothetical protein